MVEDLGEVEEILEEIRDKMKAMLHSETNPEGLLNFPISEYMDCISLRHQKLQSLFM